MSLTVLKKQLKDNAFSNIYLFYGAEEYLKSYYLNMLKEKAVSGFEQFNVCAIDGKDITPQAVTAALEAFPIMSDKKVVVLKNSGIFKSPKASDKEFWQVHLKEIPHFVCLVFYESEVDKRSALMNIVKKQGVCVEFAYSKRDDLFSWVDNIVCSCGKSIDAPAINHLLSICPPGMNQIKNELDKVITYCANKQKISMQDIDRVVSVTVESKVFQMLDCMSARNYDKTFSLLADMKELKEPPIKILVLMYRHFSILFKLKILMQKTSSYEQMAKSVKIPVFSVKNYAGAARNLSRDYMVKVLKMCVDTDFAIKTGALKDWNALYALVEYSITALKN